jgi:hypothetical protein
MSEIFILLRGRIPMNMQNESGSHNTLPASTIITTLYDLMTVIDSEKGKKPSSDGGYDIQRSNTHDHTGSVIERVALMFESGQIRFRNTRDFKKKYAELFTDDDLASR